ncbi:MAG TPA: hypothetical protein VF110_14175 [Burkholderiales bacterium]|jgi:hypothetical protein
MIDFLAGLEPQYLLAGFTVLGGLLSMPLAMAGIRRLIDLKIATGTLLMLTAALVIALGIGAALAAASLRTYNRLTQEQEAARVTTRQLGPTHYAVVVQAKSAPARSYELYGDEWQIDARLLKWRPIATIAGFDTVYRLERLSGRYTDLDKEREAKRTVHGLADRTAVDFWAMVKSVHEYLPLADALYGSAAFVPMAEGAEYVVSVSTSGLVVRPGNDAARKAVGAWK